MYSKKRQETHADTRFSFPSEDFKKWKQNTEKLQRVSQDIFVFPSYFSFSPQRRKRKLGMDTVEHTASTILVIRIVAKNLKKGLFLFHTGAFGCLQTTWISVGAFSFFSFLIPHKTFGVCKCASAIWTLSGVGFFFCFVLFGGRVAGISMRPSN